MTEVEKIDSIKLAITHGNADRYSMEVLISAISDLSLEGVQTIIYTNYEQYEKLLKELCPNEHKIKQIDSLENLSNSSKAIINVDYNPYASIERLVSDLKNFKIDAVVSLPVETANVKAVASHFKTIAHMLASSFKASNPFRLYLKDNIRWSFITSNQFDNLEARLSVLKIEERIKNLYNTLKISFGINTPKIALLETGTERDGGEISQISKSCLEQNIPIFGPYPLNSFFIGDIKDKQLDIKKLSFFDAILGMYKEQLVEIEQCLDQSRISVYTAALPILHTEALYTIDNSPLDEARLSTLNAIYTVVDMCRSKQRENKLRENMLYQTSLYKTDTRELNVF